MCKLKLFVRKSKYLTFFILQFILLAKEIHMFSRSAPVNTNILISFYSTHLELHKRVMFNYFFSFTTRYTPNPIAPVLKLNIRIKIGQSLYLKYFEPILALANSFGLTPYIKNAYPNIVTPVIIDQRSNLLCFSARYLETVNSASYANANRISLALQKCQIINNQS